MKDTLISARAKKRELIIFAICIIAAILINVYAIVSYDTAWSELYTMAGMVAAIGIILYLVQGILRLLIRGIIKLVQSLRDH